MPVDKEQLWRDVVSKAWTDPTFRQQLLDNPNGVMAQAGFEIEPGVTFEVVADTVTKRHLVLPVQPGDVTVEEAEAHLISDAHPSF